MIVLLYHVYGPTKDNKEFLSCVIDKYFVYFRQSEEMDLQFLISSGGKYCF